jgi:hypothetical protein
MKLPPLNVSAICIFIGLGGFILGKITNGNPEVSEHDRLLETSERLFQQRSIEGETDSNKRERSNHPNRPTQQRGSKSLDQKLNKLEEIARSSNPLSRGRAMLEWIDSLAPEEYEAAGARFRSLGLENSFYGEYSMLLDAWAKVDPISALNFASAKKKGFSMGTATVINQWASRDADAAIAWAKSNHEGDATNPYMAIIIKGIAASDPDRATALLQELPRGSVRNTALHLMTPHLVEMGEEGAKKWISELGDDNLRSGAIAELAVAYARNDPARSATWLLENINERTIGSFDDVYSRWAEVDPAAAISHFENIQDRNVKSRALTGIVLQDARKNPQATADLMNRFPNDLTESTVQNFIYSTYLVTPNLAVDQIGKLQSEVARNHMYRRTLSSWLQRDEVAARNWINSANLPAAVVESLNQH